jgi:hypothetical protein
MLSSSELRKLRAKTEFSQQILIYTRTSNLSKINSVVSELKHAGRLKDVISSVRDNESYPGKAHDNNDLKTNAINPFEYNISQQQC